ncbi:MAG: HNH endonuclease [Rhizobiales bacterium]|nr:HNH endonuclease [Hyphomicrobiales bacterium]
MGWKRSQITIEEVNRMVSYCPVTGKLFWKINKQNSGGIGSECGRTNSAGYRRVVLHGCELKAHQVVWMLHHGEWPSGIVDHANSNKSDNRIENLRLATKAQNAANRKSNSNNTTGVSGVTFHKPTRKWVARIGLNMKRIHIGSFEKKDDAVKAYMAVSANYRGEFCPTNKGGI